MVISNAKYNKKQVGLKNKAYLQDAHESLAQVAGELDDASSNPFHIPRYEEIRYLTPDELTQCS